MSCAACQCSRKGKDASRERGQQGEGTARGWDTLGVSSSIPVLPPTCCAPQQRNAAAAGLGGKRESLDKIIASDLKLRVGK